MNENAAIAITADSGELERQADALVRSIQGAVPDIELVTFIPENSRGEVSSDALNRFEAAGTVVWGEIPIPEYPISALVQAFVEAERVSDREYLVALDTDTVVLDTLEVSEGGDVWVRPADVGAQYWCSEDARKDWGKLTERFGLPPVTEFDSVTASVDRRTIPQYWNSGVVVTTDRSLPERWLEYTRALFYERELPVSRSEFFIDQLSLALATRKNEVQKLPEAMNYPLGGRLVVPDSVKVLHYGDRRNLHRVPPGPVRERILELGVGEDASPSDLVRSILDVASTHSGRVVNYWQKERVRKCLAEVLPDAIVRQ